MSINLPKPPDSSSPYTRLGKLRTFMVAAVMSVVPPSAAITAGTIGAVAALSHTAAEAATTVSLSSESVFSPLTVIVSGGDSGFSRPQDVLFPIQSAGTYDLTLESAPGGSNNLQFGFDVIGNPGDTYSLTGTLRVEITTPDGQTFTQSQSLGLFAGLVGPSGITSVLEPISMNVPFSFFADSAGGSVQVGFSFETDTSGTSAPQVNVSLEEKSGGRLVLDGTHTPSIPESSRALLMALGGFSMVLRRRR